MYGYIYETTNNINGKKYIGQHKSKTFDISYCGSGKLIQAAIVKYGENNFKVKVLEWCKTRDELNEKEKYYIKLLKESGQEHYNIANGGDIPGSVYDYLNNDDIKKWKHTISIKTKEAMVNKGLITENGLSNEMKYKISKATKGHSKSEEMKQKII